jgi:hypothetical protein
MVDRGVKLKSMRESFAARWISLLAAAVLMPAGAPAWAATSETRITHKPIDYFVAEKRIRLEATVADPKGVTLARAYFKAKTQADYLFVPMEAQQTLPNSYVAVLPAMAKSNESLEYLFLVVNGDNQVVKTEPLAAKLREGQDAPSWQMVPSEGKVSVWTEVPGTPSMAGSFSDSVGMDVVESGARFGIVAQIFTSGSQAAAAAGGASGAGGTGSVAVSGAAAGATSAGVVSVATGVIATTTIVAAAAVAAAGAAAAGGGGGGGGGSSAPAPTTPTTPTNLLEGAWSGSGVMPAVPQSPVDEPFTWQGTVSGTTFTGSVSGTLPITGTVSANGAFSTSPIVFPNGTCTWAGTFTVTPTRSASGTANCSTFQGVSKPGTWSGH